MFKRISLLIFVGLGFGLSAQISYEPVQTTQGLWNATVTPSGAVFIVGNNGTLLTKGAGCLTWNTVAVPTGSGLRDVAFVNDSVGVAVGVSGTIIRTTNAGATWTTVASGVSSGLLFVESFDSQTLIAGGGGSSGNLIIRSTDGGGTWATVPTALTASPFDAVVLSSTTALVCGVGGTLSRTTDAGLTWTAITSPVLAGTLSSIDFINENVGFIAAQNGNVFRSLDGGLTWATTITGTTTFLNGIRVQNPQNVWAVGNSGTIIRSQDSGTTWSTIPIPINTALRVVDYDADGLFIGGNSGTLFRLNPNVSFDVIFREDFCNFSDSIAPMNSWSNISWVDSNSLWRFDNPGSTGVDTILEAPFALYNAQFYANTGRDSAILTSGDFSTNGYGEVALRWNEVFAPNATGEVRTIIQGWDGLSWFTVFESNGDMDQGARINSLIGPGVPHTAHRSVDLPNMANLSNTRIRFIFVAEGVGPRFWWGIDDLEVVGGRRDVGLSQLSYNDSTCSFPISDDVQLLVENLGDVPIFPIQIALQIGSGQIEHRYFPISLEANADTLITLSGISVSAPGELKVWFENAYDRDFSNDTLVGQYGNIALSFSLGDTLLLCEGDSLALYSGLLADQYLWNGSPSSDTLWVNASGWYRLELISNNCNSIDSVWVEVVGMPVNVLVGLPVSILATDSVILPNTFADITRYVITGPRGVELDSIISTDLTWIPSDTGNYQIQVFTELSGCNSVESASINVSPSIGIQNFNSTAGVKLFPNPANDWVEVQYSQITSLVLIDMQGRIVLDRKFVFAQDSVRLESLNLKPGIYMLLVNNANSEQQNIRLVVQ